MHKINIPPFDIDAAKACENRLLSLAKIPKSLGKIEDLAILLAGVSGKALPSFTKKELVLFAGDHDIALHGISGTRQEVTAMQVRNFLRGGGAINAYCRTAGANLTVVDVGIKADMSDALGLVHKKVVHGTKDFSEGPAMTRKEAEKCLQVGIDMAREKIASGADLLLVGEMGIGNTSPSSAIAAVFSDLPVRSLTSIGSGINSIQLEKKIALIEQGLELNKPDPKDPLDVLAKIGGSEIGAMAGFILGGLSKKIPVILDGFIAVAAASIAAELFPQVKGLLIGSHISFECGHKFLLQRYSIPTYLDLGFRLGEGTGAALLCPIIDTSTRILTEMATLEELGIWHPQATKGS